MFQTTLKLDRRLSRFQREQIVSKTMKELDLEKCCLTRISALSGGERKRVSLATEVTKLWVLQIAIAELFKISTYLAKSS